MAITRDAQTMLCCDDCHTERHRHTCMSFTVPKKYWSVVFSHPGS